jgi:uncharacterized membrane protein (DUF4010 family)
MKFLWIFAFAGLAVATVVGMSYVAFTRAHPTSTGLTTEIAAVVVFLLGGVVLFGHRELAVAMAVVTSAVLAYKHPLHGMVAKLSQDDVYAAVKLLIATFIVLPVLPDKTLDPWDAINPYKMWWLVILISGLSLVGYVATRCLGAQRGTSLTGFFGGLVSSTAVTLSLAKRSVEEAKAHGLADAIGSGLLLAWSVMFARVVIEVAVVNASLLGSILVPMATMGALAAVSALYLLRRATRMAPATGEATGEAVPLKNPFSLTSAAKFAAFFTAVLVVVKLVQTYLPSQGFYLLAALAGLTDVDAITLSMADYAKTGDAHIAVVSIVIAALANTLVKCGFVLALGSRELRRRVVPATLLLLVGGAISVFFV